ncbi:hypothetical protein [Paenibacillus campi]|uniref:SGNH/GDSL hydrolase family protein n=1 Tax=Paenibacillus campi TaxID=3106031 RepID=UPI002AFFE95F|nr:hypothetical protein [Paenibacillus sp. SGZ-1009]
MSRNNIWITIILWGMAICTVAGTVIGLLTLSTSEKQQQAANHASTIHHTDANLTNTKLPQSNKSSEQPSFKDKHSAASSPEVEHDNLDSERMDRVVDGAGVTMIGDSLTLGIKPYLQERLPNMIIDGKVGRQMSQADDEINRLSAQGKLGDYVIIELGTNGAFSSKQLRSILKSLSNVNRVLLVTARMPEQWQDTVNHTLIRVGHEFTNVRMVDWYSASQGKEQYFYKDGTHLKPEGSRYYVSLLIAALKK